MSKRPDYSPAKTANLVGITPERVKELWEMSDSEFEEEFTKLLNDSIQGNVFIRN